MSLKAELEIWSAALKAYETEDFELAIEHFHKIGDTSKIVWNVGIILATLGRHEEAVERFEEATRLDMYFTVAYQQRGVSNFRLGRYDAAHKDFENALLYLRGNQTINYEQLGLDFRLYATEVLFNCGLSKIYLGQIDAGLADLREAATQKQTPEHGVIADAIRDQGRDYNVFSVPVGALFRPPAAKLKNLAARDYMGKAVLVAAADVNDAYTTFTGLTRLRRGQTPTGAPLDAGHSLGRSASVSAIPTPNDPTPIASRLARSNTVSITPQSGASAFSASSIPRMSPLARSQTSVRPTLAPLITTRAGSPSPPISNPSAKGSNDSAPKLLIQIESPLLQTPPREKNELRITELYDDYYQSPNAYDDDIPELPPIGARKRELEAWSKKVPAGAGLMQSGSTVTGGRATPPTSFGRNGSLARAPSGRSVGMGRRQRDGSGSNYDDEASDIGSFYDMAKIRVKVHVGSLTRGMSVQPDHTYDDFVTALRSKFPELGNSVAVRFRDEDGDMLSMQDEGDFEAAVDVARVMSKGRAEGKLEIWVD